MTSDQDEQQRILRYMAWGFEIWPNGVVFDPYNRIEVDVVFVAEFTDK